MIIRFKVTLILFRLICVIFYEKIIDFDEFKDVSESFICFWSFSTRSANDKEKDKGNRNDILLKTRMRLDVNTNELVQ